MAQLINSAFNINFSAIIFNLKLVSVILSIIFGFTGVYFIVLFRKLVTSKIKTAKLNLRIPAEVFKGASQSKWEEVLSHLESTREAEWKFSIIEADKLVEDLLKQAGYPGETMGDKLMNIESGQLVTLEGLWEAHKIRNKLAHDVNYFLRYAEARRAIGFYEQTLKELNAI